MVNEVYGTMGAKRAAMEQVHGYVKRTSPATAAAVKKGSGRVQ